jgi:hypothetical protein
VFADEQNEGVRLGDLLGQLRGPGPAGAQVRWGEETLDAGSLRSIAPLSRPASFSSGV